MTDAAARRSPWPVVVGAAALGGIALGIGWNWSGMAGGALLQAAWLLPILVCLPLGQ